MSLSFGNTSGFGAPNAAAKPAFGSNFSFGGTTSAFGAATSTPAPAFGAAPPTQAVAPTFGGFGAPTATSQAPPAFGGFGATTSTAAAAPSTGFSFGAPAASTAPTFGGFGAPAAQPAASGLSFGGFGATTSTASTAAPSFGGFGAPGATTSTGFGGFGGFGQKPAGQTTTTGFGGFGLGQQSAFGQPQQQLQQQQPVASAEDTFAQAIFKVNIFGDERDTTIARWNYIQAMWGTGKAFYSQAAAPVEITASNSLNRFKAMGYSKLQGKDNKMGLVALVFNKAQAQQIVTALNQALGSKPTLMVHVDGYHSLTDTKCQMVVYVEEKNPNTNETKKIASTDLNNFLSQPMTKQQLTNMGVEQTLSLILPDEDKLKEYMDTTPKGIDTRMWREAIKDNPDAAKFIPVPMVGFQNLKWRIKSQENEIESHVAYLAKLEEDINELKQRHANTTTKILEYRRNLADLSHRVLAVVVRQEYTRKTGVALSPEEEMLRSKLENMQALVSAPTQFNGRLSELLSQMRMQKSQWAGAGGSGNEYALDRDASEEMMAFLSMQQRAMQLLIQTVNEDMKALNVISNGMTEIMRGKE